MNYSFALALVSISALGIAACSSDADTHGDGTKTCSPSIQPTDGCPGATTVEASWGKVQSTCGITADDFDSSNASSPTLTSASKSKACVSCDCRTAIYAYASQYQDHACTTTGDEQNAAFASNLHQLAAACP